MCTNPRMSASAIAPVRVLGEAVYIHSFARVGRKGHRIIGHGA